MNDKSKVSEFGGPRREKRDGAPKPLAIQTDQVTGGDQGMFNREPCGTCFHWKRDKTQQGLGLCMMMPPNAIPVPGPDGKIVGIMNIRPAPRATDEGCDQHELEGEDDDGEEEPEPAGEDMPPLAAVGG